MNIEYNENFYNNFRKFVNFYMNHMYNIHISGLENIPENENFLYAGNHLNILDSWLLITALDDNLRFMVDEKLYKYKLWEWFFKTLGTFDISHESKNNLVAVRTAINLLKDDFSVVIFPEGKTHKINEEVPFKPGVPSIAKMAKHNLIPFGINGSYKPGSNLYINFGEVIDLSKYKKDEYDSVLEDKVRKLEIRK